MQSRLGHVQININPKNISFYKNLMHFLDWSPIFETSEMGGYISKYAKETGASVWFIPAIKQQESDYDLFGINHLGFTVETKKDVDAAATYMRKQKIKLLFDTPKHRPDFVEKPEETYYQIMFETPDKHLFEIVYTGKKE